MPLASRLIPAGRWWCSLRVAVPGRSICWHWRKSSRWTPPLNLSYIQTRMDSGGFSVFLQVSTRSRTGNFSSAPKVNTPQLHLKSFFVVVVVAKGHWKAVSVWEVQFLIVHLEDTSCRCQLLQTSNVQHSWECCDTQKIFPWDRFKQRSRTQRQTHLQSFLHVWNWVKSCWHRQTGECDLTLKLTGPFDSYLLSINMLSSEGTSQVTRIEILVFFFLQFVCWR